MLFYIKKEYLASTTGAPLVLPEHLQKEVEEANKALAAARASYDEEVNRIDVFVSAAVDFRVESSVIMPLDPSSATPESPCVRQKFTIDQRMAFEDFRALVIASLAEKFPEPLGEGVLHTFVPVGQGAWHLFTRVEAPSLTEGKVASVADAGVKHGAALMLWNGATICGEPVHPGAENEPLVLSVHQIPKKQAQDKAAQDKASESAQLRQQGPAHPAEVVITVSLAKSASLGELKVLLAEKVGAPAEKLLLHQMDRMHENAWGKQTKIPVAPLLAELDPQSLQALGITSLTKLTVEEVSEEQAKAKIKDMTLRAAEAFDRISRSLHLNVVFPEAGGTTPLEVDCEKTDKISDFKARVTSMFAPAPGADGKSRVFRLRLNTDDSQSAALGLLLADETKTLGEAGAVTNATIVLEEGALPDASQVVLRLGLGLKAREYLSKLAAPKEGSNAGSSEKTLAELYPDRASLLRHQELVVPRSTKVQELLAMACNKMQLHGEEWHLNLTNWCGELAEALRDMTVSVDTLKLTHNYLLLLERGAILPKVGSKRR